MMFVLRMAWREVRASWSRLAFFFLCVAVGVAAIVAVRSIIQDVRSALLREARVLVGADLIVQSGRAWTPGVTTRLDNLLARPGVRERREVIETNTMASTDAGEVRLVEVRAVDPGVPYYGPPVLGSGAPFEAAPLRGGVIVPPTLLTQLGVSVGDTLRLAGQPFVIRDTVEVDRQQSAGFAFGPRVYITTDDLRATTMLQTGSRVRYQWFIRVEDAVLGGLERDLREQLRQDLVSVRSWQSVEDRLGQNLTRAENYLSLVGFAMVVLGGVGVWSVTRVFIQQKLRSVAILKCVGASSRQVLATYMLQIVGLSVLGGLCGVGLAAIALALVPAEAVALAGVTSVGVTWSAAVQGLTVGALVSLLFAVVPLLEVRSVKPLLLLRADTVATARRRGWESIGVAVVLGAALTAVAIWQASAVQAGVYVSAGLAVVAGVLAVAGIGLLRLVRPLTTSRTFAVRHAVVSLGRPGNQTRVILTAVGLGCFFILGVRALQTNLLAEFDGEFGTSAPDLVLIDIQRDQVDGVRRVVAPHQAAEPVLLPMLRGRVVRVDGVRVQLPTVDAVRRTGELGREFGLTFRGDLADNERVVAGRYWTGPSDDPEAPLEVSIEAETQESVGLALGDRISFDIAGRVVEAVVTSVRSVAWDDTQNGGFIFVFRPGPVIERAPHTVVGFVQADAASRGALQRDLVRAYPNVSVIDVGAILVSVREVVGQVSVAVTVVGAVTAAGGLLILVGAVAMTRFQRVYDAAIYRTLGAGTARLAAMVAIEYGVLGALAGLLGALGALGLSWVVAERVFAMTWRPDWWGLVVGVPAVAGLVALVGLAASLDVIVRKPLATLRGV